MFMEDSDHNLIELGADMPGGPGVNVKVGSALVPLLERLLPSKYVLRKSVDRALGQRVIEKIRCNRVLDEAEMSFAEIMLSEPVVKVLRLERIKARATQFDDQTPLLLTEGKASGRQETSDDWI